MKKNKPIEVDVEALKVQQERNLAIYKAKIAELSIEIKAMEKQKVNINGWIAGQLKDSQDILSKEIENYKTKNSELKRLISINDINRLKNDAREKEIDKVVSQNKIITDKLKEELENKNKRIDSEQKLLKEKESHLIGMDKSVKEQSRIAAARKKLLDDEYKYLADDRRKNSDDQHKIKIDKEISEQEKKAIEDSLRESEIKKDQITKEGLEVIRKKEDVDKAVKSYNEEIEKTKSERKKLVEELDSLNEIKIKLHNDQKVLQESHRKLKSWETRLDNREKNIKEKERAVV